MNSLTIAVSHGNYRHSETVEASTIKDAINSIHAKRLPNCGYAIETNSPRFPAFAAELAEKGSAQFGWADYTINHPASDMKPTETTDSGLPAFDPDLAIDGPENSNRVRADRGKEVVGLYAAEAGFTRPGAGEDPCLFQDLMTDMLHHMHSLGMQEVSEEEFIQMARMAHGNFLEESTAEKE